MTAESDIARMRTLVAELRRTLVSLAADYGDTVDIHRLKDDVARLAADLSLLASASPRHGAPAEAEIVYISDEDYAPDFWADSDDEGLGAPGRR